MEFNLQFGIEQISELAGAYEYRSDEKELEVKIIKIISPSVRERGYFKWDEFRDVCRWKTARSASLCELNQEELIQEVRRWRDPRTVRS